MVQWWCYGWCIGLLIRGLVVRKVKSQEFFLFCWLATQSVNIIVFYITIYHYFIFQNKFLDKSLNLKSGPGPGSLLFGTPSYPSPLDRIRPTKKDRAIELGLTTMLHDSLDLNATFPKMYKAKSRHDEHQMDIFKPKRNLDQISSKLKTASLSY